MLQMLIFESFVNFLPLVLSILCNIQGLGFRDEEGNLGEAEDF